MPLRLRREGPEGPKGRQETEIEVGKGDGGRQRWW